MCQIAMNADTGVCVNSARDLRAIVGPISNHDGIDDREDDQCLCGIDIQSALKKAGFEAWDNPDMIPEVLFRRKNS